MTNVKSILGKPKVEFDDVTVTLPHGAKDYFEIQEVFVILLGSWRDPDPTFWKDDYEPEDSDFELENPDRNVVGFELEGELKWKIRPAPDDPPEGETDSYYIDLWTVDGDLWARNRNQRAYRVDVETGDLLENLPANQLRLAEQTIEFDNGWVAQVLHHEDFVAVRLDGSRHPNSSGKNLYVFERDGTERWWIGDRLRDDAPSSAPGFTNIWIDDGDLCGYATDGYGYRFDIETGELLDVEWMK